MRGRESGEGEVLFNFCQLYIICSKGGEAISYPNYARSPCERGKNIRALVLLIFHLYHSRVVVDVEQCCLERGPRAFLGGVVACFAGYTPVPGIPYHAVPYSAVPYHVVSCCSRGEFFFSWHVSCRPAPNSAILGFCFCVGVRGLWRVLCC